MGCGVTPQYHARTVLRGRLYGFVCPLHLGSRWRKVFTLRKCDSYTRILTVGVLRMTLNMRMAELSDWRTFDEIKHILGNVRLEFQLARS